MPTTDRLRAWVRLALLGAALASALARGQAAQADGRLRLVFFGDSLTAGYGLPDPQSQAYPALIQQRIDEQHLPWTVVNAGLSGETSAGGLRRIDWVLRERVDLLVLELGGNDGLRGTAPEETRANLQAIIDRVRARYPKARIVIAGMRMPASMGPDYAEAFQRIYPDLAASNGLSLIAFLLEGAAGNPQLMQADGIHPNPAGAAVVARHVWEQLGSLLRPAQSR